MIHLQLNDVIEQLRFCLPPIGGTPGNYQLTMGDNFQEQMLSFWESLDVIVGRTLNNDELHMGFYGEQCACTCVCASHNENTNQPTSIVLTCNHHAIKTISGK